MRIPFNTPLQRDNLADAITWLRGETAQKHLSVLYSMVFADEAAAAKTQPGYHPDDRLYSRRDMAAHLIGALETLERRADETLAEIDRERAVKPAQADEPDLMTETPVL